MNNEAIRNLLDKLGPLDGETGFWRVHYRDRVLFVITDEAHNRMRIMTPIIEESELSEDMLRTLLAANFDRALDAKFALAQDRLWSLFVHPLSELAPDPFLDAVDQVATLAENFGTTFASTDLFFGGDDS